MFRKPTAKFNSAAEQILLYLHVYTNFVTRYLRYWFIGACTCRMQWQETTHILPVAIHLLPVASSDEDSVYMYEMLCKVITSMRE